jgi:hypothetical protein
MSGLSEIEKWTLRAIMLEGPAGRAAFFRWTDEVNFEDASQGVRRLSPFLYRRARQYGYSGPLLSRLRSVTRYIVVSNELKLRQLPDMLAGLRPFGGALLIKGAASLARLASWTELRRMADIDLLITPTALASVLRHFQALGFRPANAAMDISPSVLTTRDVECLHAIALVRQPYEEYDLHWHPLPTIHDERLGAEMRAAAETLELVGAKVQVPPLADHMFNLLVHGLGETEERRIDHIFEAGALIANAPKSIDWRRFRALCVRYGLTDSIAALVQELGELGVNVPLRLPVGRAAPDVHPEISQSGRPSSGYKGRLASWLGWRPPPARVRHSRAWELVAALPSGGLSARRALDWALACPGDFVAPLESERQPTRSLIPVAGFSFPENSGRWTIGRQAVLSVPVEPAVRPTALVLRLAPFLPRSDSRITAHFATTLELAVATFGASTEWQIVLLAKGGLESRVAIGLSLNGAAAPGRLGEGRADLRLLGLRVVSAQEADLHPAEPEQAMTEANGRLILAQGFSLAEPPGRWTDGPTARCLCRVGPWAFNGFRLILHFSLVHAPDDGALRLVARAGSGDPARVQLAHGKPGQAILVVDATAILVHGHVIVDLSVDNPSSPLQSGASEDPRQLGVLVSALVALPLAEAGSHIGAPI